MSLQFLCKEQIEEVTEYCPHGISSSKARNEYKAVAVISSKLRMQ